MKILTISIFLMLIQFLSGAELTVEKVGKISLLTLRIDSSELFAKDDKIDYRAIFELFNSDGEVVSLIKKDIALSTTDIKNNNYVILFLEEELKVGNYSGFLKLNSNIRKDKKEEKFNFSVEKNQHFSKLYLIKNVNDMKIEVTSWDEINENSEVYLYQIYKEEVQNLKFISENSEGKKETDFNVIKKLNHKIDEKYLIDDFSNCYIEFTQNNQFYKHEVTLEKKLNSFQRKYTWDEQLSQIKYIVNNQTWKEINRNSKMSKSEKVLRFWESNNPKNSATNELQEIFYKRILQADQRFSVHKYKNGWETDRGRIFIKFGEPDQISVDNYPIGKYPTQTWYYYQINKTFHFYDRSRIEDYKLYNKEEEYGY